MKGNYKSRLINFIVGAVLLLFLNTRAQVPIITTIAGNGIRGYHGDGGPADSAKLDWPSGIALDLSGNIYIADWENNVIRKVNAATGIISTIVGNGYGAGLGGGGYSGDGGSADSAELSMPSGVALDKLGNIYIADSRNGVIRKVDISTNIIHTIAGGGHSPGTDGIGDGELADSAELNQPNSLFIDNSGNIYIADSYNNRIRKITASTGIITTVAGNGMEIYNGDGISADSAALNVPTGVTVDDSGNIYIADFYNNRIRKVSVTTGIISTIAGNGYGAGLAEGGYSGDGGPADSAELSLPVGVALDDYNNIYISDEANNVIRKVSAITGVITTIVGNGYEAGTGLGGYSGDGGPADSAELSSPIATVIDGLGNIYISDNYNNRIRKVTVKITSINDLPMNNGISIYPNPVSKTIHIRFNDNLNTDKISLTDMAGNAIYNTTYNGQNIQTLDVTNLAAGVYFISLQDEHVRVVRKFVKE